MGIDSWQNNWNSNFFSMVTMDAQTVTFSVKDGTPIRTIVAGKARYHLNQPNQFTQISEENYLVGIYLYLLLCLELLLSTQPSHSFFSLKTWMRPLIQLTGC